MSDSGRQRPDRTATAQVARFLLVGGANTAVTALVFYALSFPLETWVAFTVAYALGLMFVTTVTPRFVFATRPPTTHRVALAMWYVVVYLVGVGVSTLLDADTAAPRAVVVLGTLAVTAPLGFLGSRVIVGPQRAMPR
jgi:putative flippase GtrA